MKNNIKLLDYKLTKTPGIDQVVIRAVISSTIKERP